MADKIIETELTLRVRVKVTDEVRQGVAEGLVDAYTHKPLQLSDEQISHRIVFASLNPRLYGWQCENETADDYWDGVCNMRGLIQQYDLVWDE